MNNDKCSQEKCTARVRKGSLPAGPDYGKAKEMLLQEKYTCVLCRGDDLQCSRQNGIRPLLAWIRDNKDYTGCSAADQIVGKAAALLYARMGIVSLYGQVMSERAIPVLEKFHIFYEAEKTAPYIINRAGDGMCPMEQTVLDLDDPDAAFDALSAKVEELMQQRPDRN